MSDDPIAEVLARAQRLPVAAVVKVFERYGKPLAIELPRAQADDQQAALELEDGCAATVRVLQVRMPVDVIANDWFVLEQPDAEPLAIPGPLFGAAIAALSRPRDAIS
jgi:hypothetical protein